MRQISLIPAILAVLACSAAAADPTGEWRVESGEAHIRTAVCDGRLWGIVSWERTPGTDARNPDPALRRRATLGLPIVLGMTAVQPDRWQGPIYNAKNGKTHQATITLKRPDRLDIEGCVLSGWVCSGETWNRVVPAPGSIGSAPGSDLCLRLGAGAGLPHQGGLK